MKAPPLFPMQQQAGRDLNGTMKRET